METKKLEISIFITLFAILSVLIFFVFQPFLYILVLAMVLSVLFRPLYQKLVGLFHGGKSFVACLMVTIALIFIVAPIIFFGFQIFGQAQDFFPITRIQQGNYIYSVQQNVNTFIGHFVPGFSFNVADLVSKMFVFVSNSLGGILSQTAYIFFQTFFLLFAFFFFVRDGEKMLDAFVALSPFEKEQNKQIIHSVERTITSVIRGTLFVGLIRFVILAAVFYLMGIPSALLWAGIGGIIGAVPGLGTPFFIVPACIFFLLSGNAFLAVAMLLFGILLTFFIDNLLSTYFFGKGLDVPAIFVLFSILGGIFFFGPLGFIFGPIILSLFISAVDMYKILVLKN